MQLISKDEAKFMRIVNHVPKLGIAIGVSLALFGCTTNPPKTLLYQSTAIVGGYKQQQISKSFANGDKSELLATKGEHPQWIPGVKTHFAYLERQAGKPEQRLWIAKDDGTGALALTGFDVHFDYTWSPDGNWLLVSHTKDKNYEIYKIKKDGSQQVRLTNNAYTDQFPRWTPKAHPVVDKIVYVSTGGSAGNKLFLIDANGQGPAKQLTPSSMDVYAASSARPCWLKKEAKVAFIGSSKTASDVFTVDVVTGAIQNLTNKPSVYSRLLCHYDNHLFYFDQSKLYRFDTKAGKVDPTGGLGNFYSEHTTSSLSANAAEVFFSYGPDALKPEKIIAVQHYTGKVRTVGPGRNPDIW